MNGIRRTNRKKEMQASLRKLRVQKPLSDCSNTVSVTVTDSTAASTQSSTASTSTLKRQNPTLFSVKKTLASLTGRNDGASNPWGSASPPAIASTPSTPRVSSSVSGTSDYEVSEPSSVYSRRQTALKRKIKEKDNDVLISCPRTPKTWNVGKKKKQDGLNRQSKMDTTPIASTPRPRISSSTSDTTDHEVYEPFSVYSRRQTAPKRKSKGKENIGASSCPPALKIWNTCMDNSKEYGQNSPSKKSKAPCKKKQQVVSAEKNLPNYTYPQDFLEQQRAYFAEVDKFELPVEEAEVWELDK